MMIGEPSGTAGSPILKIVLEKGLSNVLVVVTRYFGGILLGTGGLVRAYSEATIKALEKAKIVNKKKGYKVKIVTAYDQIEQFNYYVNKNMVTGHCCIRVYSYHIISNNIICPARIRRNIDSGYTVE